MSFSKILTIWTALFHSMKLNVGAVIFFLPVNDLGLCEDCASKLDRDMIRKRDWAYSVLAFGCPKPLFDSHRYTNSGKPCQ